MKAINRKIPTGICTRRETIKLRAIIQHKCYDFHFIAFIKKIRRYMEHHKFHSFLEHTHTQHTMK